LDKRGRLLPTPLLPSGDAERLARERPSLFILLSCLARSQKIERTTLESIAVRLLQERETLGKASRQSVRQTEHASDRFCPVPLAGRIVKIGPLRRLWGALRPLT